MDGYIHLGVLSHHMPKAAIRLDICLCLLLSTMTLHGLWLWCVRELGVTIDCHAPLPPLSLACCLPFTSPDVRILFPLVSRLCVFPSCSTALFSFDSIIYVYSSPHSSSSPRRRALIFLTHSLLDTCLVVWSTIKLTRKSQLDCCALCCNRTRLLMVECIFTQSTTDLQVIRSGIYFIFNFVSEFHHL